MSVITTLLQPPASADMAVTKPIGPDPYTSAMSPGLIPALVAAIIPTATGSTIAPSASETPSGSLNVNFSGCTTSGLKHP